MRFRSKWLVFLRAMCIVHVLVRGAAVKKIAVVERVGYDVFG